MTIKINQAIAVFIFLCLAANAWAQVKQLTIEDCYNLTRQNYPLIKKQALILKSSQFSIDNASMVYRPQLSINGQATYQSETISFPKALSGVSGVSLPSLSKDQYRIQAELSQQIYDGGNTKNQKALLNANEHIQQQSLEVNLATLKDRVNQVYFSILLMDEQLKQNQLRKIDLEGALDKANVALKNGTGFKSNTDELKAALISVDMAAIEFTSNRKACMEMLSLLIGHVVDESTQLTLPTIAITISGINRPELKLYDLQRITFDIQERQLRSDFTPKLNAFVQGAYGRPTLNIIENKFGPWWLGGIRVSWSLSGLYTQKNNKSLLNINRQNLDVDKETFLLNTDITLRQQNADIKKYADLIQQDDAVVLLRSSILKSAKSQLDNGIITVHEYIGKLNEENMAKQSRVVHNILLLQAQYNYKNTSGN